MLRLTFDDVDKFIDQQRRLGNNVRSDQYEIVFFHPSRRAWSDEDGRFDRRSGKWGFETRITYDDNGVWSVNPKNVRTARRSRPRPR